MSSRANNELIAVVTMTRPTTTHNDVQNPSISTPGSRSRSQPTNTTLRTIAPSPSVEDGQGNDEEHDRRPDDRIADADDEACEQSVPARFDRETRHDRGQQPPGEGGDDGDDGAAPHDASQRRSIGFHCGRFLLRSAKAVSHGSTSSWRAWPRDQRWRVFRQPRVRLTPASEGRGASAVGSEAVHHEHTHEDVRE